jgi:arginase
VRVELIQSPYDLGREGVAVGAGPDRIVDAGAVEALAAAGHEVDVVRVTPRSEESNEVGASFELLHRLSEAVSAAVERGALPIVLAGNCLSSVGTVAGLGRDVGVVWLDAHADFNSEDTTASGFLDGMGVSVLTGTGWRNLRESVPGYRSVPEENVVLVGIRDVDDAEQERLEASGVRVVPPAETEPGVAQALDDLRGRTGDVYLHIDLDVLDPSEGNANRLAAPGGLAAGEVERVVDAVAERLNVRAAAFTSYDPGADGEGTIAAIACALVTRIAAHAEAGAPAR